MGNCNCYATSYQARINTIKNDIDVQNDNDLENASKQRVALENNRRSTVFIPAKFKENKEKSNEEEIINRSESECNSNFNSHKEKSKFSSNNNNNSYNTFNSNQLFDFPNKKKNIKKVKKKKKY